MNNSDKSKNTLTISTNKFYVNKEKHTLAESIIEDYYKGKHYAFVDGCPIKKLPKQKKLVRKSKQNAF